MDFVPLSMNGTKNQQLLLNINVFVFCPIFMMKGYQSSHNETAASASAWRQQNADWWSEMKITNHNTHHPENSSTNRCGIMDTDDEAA